MKKPPRAKLLTGDCLVRLKKIPDNTFTSVVCDPPYGLSDEPDMVKVLEHWLHDKSYQHGKVGFMSAEWDSFVPGPLVWREILRVLKPGGSAFVFGGTRTVDLLTIALRLAGFSIRDQLVWLYGSGMPHGLDISKAIDKAAGVEREVVGTYESPEHTTGWKSQSKCNVYGKSQRRDGEKRDVTAPATPDAQRWDGWNTQIKPAHEPIVWCMKPTDGSFVDNALQHGVAGLNVDGCRLTVGAGGNREGEATACRRYADKGGTNYACTPGPRGGDSRGRYPSNLLLDETAAELLNEQAGESKSPETYQRGAPGYNNGVYGEGVGEAEGSESINYGDQGGVSRFFYTAKVSNWERNAGCDDLTEQFAPTMGDGPDAVPHNPEAAAPKRNTHPTLKPITLLRYLVRLLKTPERSWVLDPFMGSGSTGMACMLEGQNFCGVELQPEFVEISKRRIAYAKQHPEMFSETEPVRQDRKPRPKKAKPKAKGLWGNRRK